MANVKSIINEHNKTVLDRPTNNSERTYNCINIEKFPLQEKCLTNNIMYEATLTLNKDTYQHKIYYGITEITFKKRYANHVKSFRHETLNFRMNCGAPKATNTLQMLYGKYLENTSCKTLTTNSAPCV